MHYLHRKMPRLLARINEPYVLKIRQLSFWAAAWEKGITSLGIFKTEVSFHIHAPTPLRYSKRENRGRAEPPDCMKSRFATKVSRAAVLNGIIVGKVGLHI